MFLPDCLDLLGFAFSNFSQGLQEKKRGNKKLRANFPFFVPLFPRSLIFSFHSLSGISRKLSIKNLFFPFLFLHSFPIVPPMKCGTKDEEQGTTDKEQRKIRKFHLERENRGTKNGKFALNFLPLLFFSCRSCEKFEN